MSELLDETQDPGMSGGGRPRSRRRQWDEQLEEYVRFIREWKRIPSQRAEDPRERALHHWLQHQRASLRSGLLLADRAQKLDRNLPGWNGRFLSGGHEPSSSDHERWSNRLGQVLEHLETYGKLPVMGVSSSPEEYFLGRWISRQRYALKTGSLHPNRVTRLDKLVPGWRGRGM
ncbi:helicase associated domain-containing protein [Arthrobacter sp. ISL-30]|nr:helicase associated domain-containing protein [Arthrobacter sp. ISL-30]